MSPNDMYQIARGLAFQSGLDNFEDVISKDLAVSLWRGRFQTASRSWSDERFIKWLICVAGREHRKRGLFPPKCESNCKYRQKYADLDNQSNALRIEFFAPQDRCGWNLKKGRMGGRPDDYHACTFKG